MSEDIKSKTSLTRFYETKVVDSGKITYCGKNLADIKIHGRVYSDTIAVQRSDGRINLHILSLALQNEI